MLRAVIHHEMAVTHTTRLCRPPSVEVYARSVFRLASVSRATNAVAERLLPSNKRSLSDGWKLVRLQAIVKLWRCSCQRMRHAHSASRAWTSVSRNPPWGIGQARGTAGGQLGSSAENSRIAPRYYRRARAYPACSCFHPSPVDIVTRRGKQANTSKVIRKMGGSASGLRRSGSGSAERQRESSCRRNDGLQGLSGSAGNSRSHQIDPNAWIRRVAAESTIRTYSLPRNPW